MPSRSKHSFDDDDEYRGKDNENDDENDAYSVEEDEDAEVDIGDDTEDGTEAQTEEEPLLLSTRQSRKRHAAAAIPLAPPGAKKRERGQLKGSKNKPKTAP
ncbi:hypothetical protein FNAPI_14100 [Fusarium napiforme]|uniref:Uncharacterized protein n=1 Tax=Fusarium napiforme TaxID=42672 RepID=A0A8H5I3Q4_9HYPO|nr:hypothetical protein FNAPI_14100 [Fusarium napiforme]